ncbi:hypothetical protein ACHAXT_000710 [Thalassiosira profunda]
MAGPSRGGEGRRGSGRRRRSEVSSCPSAATGISSGRHSGRMGGSLRDSATTGSGRRRRRPPSPVTTLASMDPDEMRNGGVDPDGNTAYSSRGGAASPDGGGNGPVGDEEEFASSRRSRRLASIERRAQRKGDSEQKQKEKDEQKGALVVADAASRSHKGSRKSERRGSSRGEGELSSEAKRYAARARQKASLMTNHDFQSRNGRSSGCSGGRSGGRSGKESKSVSKTTKASKGSKQSKSTGKTTKESSTTGEPSWISGQMSISNQSATSKAGTKADATLAGTLAGTQTGTLEGTLEETFISGALSVSKKSYRSNIDSKTRSWNYERGNIYRDEEEDVGEAEEEEEAYEEWTASTSTLPDMTDRTIGGLSGRTSVSSMTSTDSYVREQRYLHQLKLEELQARRELRAEQRRRAMAMGEYFDDGTCEEEDTVFIGADESGLGSFAAGTYDQTRTSGRSSRRSSSRRSSGRSRRSSQCSATHDQIKAARQTYDESYNQSSRDRSCRTRASRSSSRHSSRRSSQDGTPVYQREECCIKHPAVLLQSQTNVNVWTCERYIKDEESGRWHTAKMVCRACLDEAAEDGRYERQRKDRAKDDPKSYRSIALTARTEDSYYSDESDEDMAGSTSSPEGSSVPSDGTWTKAATVGVRPLEDQTPLEREAEAQRRRFVRRLAARAYHFPGNSWWEDWVQYTKNTHLVFGIFLHHRLHPVTSRERCVILLGSVAVGMMMSNIIYLWFVHYEFRKDDVVLNLWGLDVTKLMVTLWTVGSMAHTGFDLAIWHIKACTACRYFGGGHVHDGAVRCGRRVGVTIVLITLAFSSYLVLLRASEDYEAAQAEALAEAGDKLEGLDDDAVKRQGESFLSSVTLGGGAEHFDFLLGYIIEFVLAVFVYNPLILTVVFTGVLGCNGRIPILGGRPREVAREERYARKRQQYTMPRVLKLGDVEYEADGWGDPPATNF